MDEAFDIQEYMTKGVERVVSEALKATISNPRESAFMLKFAAATKKASEKRKLAQARGEHIPPFLIASITSNCNLHCAGCYSRCTNATTDSEPVQQMSDKDWKRIFDEADSLGISFILLAGGEPLLRRDVIEAAGQMKNILFPVFTNGTFFNADYMELFNRKRNLVPVLSIEGDREATDARRGDGVFDMLVKNMKRLNEKGIIFGVSVTVTTENLEEVTSEGFVSRLMDIGCRLVLYVEYVPMSEESQKLAPEDTHRELLTRRIDKYRKELGEAVFVSFPGDEKSSGGCIAAGRGFFHINSHGGAEPCPFSPYSDVNVRDTSLKEALKSRLFMELRDGEYLTDDHSGGCVLYEKRAAVEELVQ